MKPCERDKYRIILLEDNKCKCLYVIYENKYLCAWLDFDGFSYNQTMIVSGVYILDGYKNKGLLQFLINELEEVYLNLYNGYKIEVKIINPKIKAMIKRVKRLSMFNNAAWKINEKKITSSQYQVGIWVFKHLTKQKIQFLRELLRDYSKDPVVLEQFLEKLEFKNAIKM